MTTPTQPRDLSCNACGSKRLHEVGSASDPQHTLFCSQCGKRRLSLHINPHYAGVYPSQQDAMRAN